MHLRARWRDRSRCLRCRAFMFDGDVGRLCPPCWVLAAAAVWVLGWICVFLACNGGPRWRYSSHADTPPPAPMWDPRPLPDCRRDAPTPGAPCTVCLDEPDDRELIGRGRAEGCYHRAHAHWVGPTPTPGGLE